MKPEAVEAGAVVGTEPTAAADELVVAILNDNLLPVAAVVVAGGFAPNENPKD